MKGDWWKGRGGRETYNQQPRLINHEMIEWRGQLFFSFNQSISFHQTKEINFLFFDSIPLFDWNEKNGRELKKSIITVWIIQIIRGENLKKWKTFSFEWWKLSSGWSVLSRRQQQTTINLNFLFENEKVGLIWLIAAFGARPLIKRKVNFSFIEGRCLMGWRDGWFVFVSWWGLWALQRHGLRQRERTKTGNQPLNSFKSNWNSIISGMKASNGKPSKEN